MRAHPLPWRTTGGSAPPPPLRNAPVIELIAGPAVFLAGAAAAAWLRARSRRCRAAGLRPPSATRRRIESLALATALAASAAGLVVTLCPFMS